MSLAALRSDSDADRRLRSLVHPEDWVNPEPAGRYNLVILGAGAAGLVTAAGAAGLGAKVALVESQLMGGDCLNVGCVPSKALIRAAHAAHAARTPQRFGIQPAGEPKVDFAAVMERMRGIRAEIAPVDSAERFRDELGVDVFFGRGRFVADGTVDVAGRALRYKKAVIATGASPFVPPVPGLAEAGCLTNDSLFALDTLPDRLLVLGGGPIGCELAQAFARLGARVELVEMLDRLMPREDEDAAALVRAALERDGVRVRLGTQLEAVRVEGDARIACLAGGTRREELPVDAILVAVGRSPNVTDMGLETVGVQVDGPRGVVVDDRLRTTNRRIFAAGDVCLSAKFTHTADFSARTVIRNALFFGRDRFSALTLPWCTYTDPEVAHVGLYADEARSQGKEVDTFERPLTDVDRALTDGADEGFVRIHVARGKGRILGATIVGPRAGEMISEISVAMEGGLTLGRLASVIHPYPTLADAIRQCGDAYNRTRLTPTVQRLFERFLAFTR